MKRLLSQLTLALLFGGLSMAHAHAQMQTQAPQPVTLSAGYTVQTDSNLYRLSSTDNAQTLLGRSSAADRISITSLGMAINQPISLQRLELNVNLVDYRYQNFSALNFTAQNYQAAWRWSVTPRLHGNLLSSREDVLGSFADIRGTTQPNQRTTRDDGVDSTYEIDGSWRALIGFSNQKRVNQQLQLADSDYRSRNVNLGLRYVAPSGSSLSYRINTARGDYLQRSPSATGLFDDQFDQLDTGLHLTWLINGKASADINATHISRTHPHFAQRDYSGLNTGVTVNWGITGKTAFSAGWSHELASYQTNYANYSQTNSVSLSPVWYVSANTTLRLRYALSQRSYLGRPDPLVNLQRADTQREAAISFDWQPHQRLMISTALQNSQRDSNLIGLDYTSSMATVSAQYSF